jgi:hypothetical protein
MQFQKLCIFSRKHKNIISQIIQTFNLCFSMSICLNNSSSIRKYSKELKQMEETIGIIDKFLSKLLCLETLQVKQSKLKLIDQQSV